MPPNEQSTHRDAFQAQVNDLKNVLPIGSLVGRDVGVKRLKSLVAGHLKKLCPARRREYSTARRARKSLTFGE